MKIPIVKEWGSWVVYVSSLLAALVTGLLTHPWQTGRDFSIKTILTVCGLTFLINSKNSLASTLRTKGQQKEHLLWFLFFSLTGLLLLIPFLVEGIKSFWFFSLLAVSSTVLLC
jgi:hypothetical protein